MSISAAQHIYTNVEKERSPRGIGGFQTLFYTKSSLSEAEIDEIEGRLLYLPSQGDEVKRVFFTTSSGKVVAGQAVALPEPDSAGRLGRYFAHSLVLTQEAFLELGASPFWIFDHFPFMTTVEKASAQGDSGTGDIGPAVLENLEDRQNELDAARAWPQNAYKMLAFLALRAEQLAADRASIVVLGDTAQAEVTLRASLLAVPGSRRALCTFDTHFAGCNPVATYFWAVGLPEKPPSSGISVDPASKQVVGAEPASPHTSYERWVAACLDGGRIATIPECREPAFALCEWLDGRTPDPGPADGTALGLVEAVFRANTDVVRDRLQRKLRALLPQPLADRILPVAVRRYRHDETLSHLRAGFHRAELADLLYEEYSRGAFRLPAKEEIRALDEWLSESDHRGLRILLAWWLARRDQLHEELRRQTEDEYTQFVTEALKSPSATPMLLFLPERAVAFLEVFLPTVVPGTLDVTTWADVLLRDDNPSALSLLTYHVPHLSPRDLRALDKLIHDYPDIPAPFADAVHSALENVKPGIVSSFLRKYLSPRGEGESAQAESTSTESEKHHESRERSEGDDGSK